MSAAAMPASARAAAADRSEHPHHRVPHADDLVVHDDLDKKSLRDELDAIRKRLARRLHPRERAQLLIRAASLEIVRENYGQAIRDYGAAIETGALSRTETAEGYKFVGRLYMALEPPEYDKAIVNLKKSIAISEGGEPAAE